MAVISVEVPDTIAKKVNYKVISIDTLYNYDNQYSDDIVDFWKDWIWKTEFMEYLSNK